MDERGLGTLALPSCLRFYIKKLHTETEVAMAPALREIIDYIQPLMAICIYYHSAFMQSSLFL